MEKGNQLHAQPALPAKQQPKQGFDRRLLWPQNWSEGAGKISFHAGNLTLILL